MEVHEPQLSVADIESGIEDLIDEIERLIAGAPSAEREALHDYAVSLVREKLPAVEPVPAMTADLAQSASGNNPTMLLGYGFLLLPVGFLMLLVFAPLGAALMATALGLIVIGGLGGLFARGRRE